MKNRLLLFLFFISSINGFSQYFELGGKILDAQLQPISYATIRIKENDLGTTSDAKGEYKFTLPSGKYELVISMIGYTQQSAIVILDNSNTKQNIILKKSANIINGIRVTNTRKDKSEDIIKNTIAAKDALQKTSGTYNVSMYIKASQEADTVKRKGSKFFERFIKDDDTADNDSTKIAKDSINKTRQQFDGMAMTEVIINLDFQYPNKIKETREGVKKTGDTKNLFYKSRTDGDFNFYKNLVSVPSLSEMSFLSPISYSGLIAYKYKMLNIVTKDGRKYYRIKVTPTKTGNALVEGEMTIMDSTWALTNFAFTFPKYHTPEYSSFTLDQTYAEIAENIWLPSKQIFTYSTAGNDKINGKTIVNYKNYKLDTVFAKKHFGNELSSTAQEAYERDSTFWTTQRPEPLSEKELKYIQFKDSIYQLTHSEKYLDSIDQETNKVTFLKIAWSGYNNMRHQTNRRISINPLISIWNPFFIGGNRFGEGIFYNKRFKNRKSIEAFAFGSYGVVNKDIVGSVFVAHTYNPFSQGRIGGGISNNFDFIFSGDAIINLISRNNIYKKRSISGFHSIELINGLYLRNDFEIARRYSLYNYKTVNRKLDTVSGRENRPIQFDSYNALYTTVTLSYTPQQQYLREPNQKIVLGSAWPTFYAKWKKGVSGILSSSTNFDYIELGLTKKINAGTLGIGNLSAHYGNMITEKRLEVVDYKWVRRGDPYIFFNPENNFQALDSTFAMFKGFAEAHYYHTFNGAIINKIPYAKFLKLTESAGSNVLYSRERNLIYIEGFVGIEKQIRFLGEMYRVGAFMVASYANNFSNPIQWKFGVRHYDAYRNKWE
jgi:Family of unknown function (DUF5686)/CarboxypepD_reg-like domain